jgi:hypothetical protein
MRSEGKSGRRLPAPIAVVGTLVLAWALFHVSEGFASRFDTAGLFSLAISAAFLAAPLIAGYVVVSWLRHLPVDRHWLAFTQLPMTRPSAAVALGVLVTGIVFGLVAGVRGHNYVVDYCSYGAVSEAQLAGCIDHVTADQVSALDTPAARSARDELGCGAGSGPFCAGRGYVDPRIGPWD